MKARPQPLAAHSAFTLIEMLTSTAILAMIIIACMTSLGTLQRSFVQSRSKVDQFREARVAFELISRNLAQATLSSYWDYYFTETQSNVPPASGSGAPAAYIRQSDLHFVSGRAAALLGADGAANTTPGHAVFFQAPLGLTQDGSSLGSLLNARGYAVKFLSDEAGRPPFINRDVIPVKHRYRLVEFRPPAEKVAGITDGNTIYAKPDTWYKHNLTSSMRVVADNILLLILSPRVSDQQLSGVSPWAIAPQYRYNSADPDNRTDAVESLALRTDGSAAQGTQHLLPPIVNVTLVAADEVSLQRWIGIRGSEPVDILQESGATFYDASLYDSDLARLSDYLLKQKLNYYIFNAAVPLRNARWDTQNP